MASEDFDRGDARGQGDLGRVLETMVILGIMLVLLVLVVGVLPL